MEPTTSASRFACCTRPRAVVVLAVTLAVLVCCLSAALSRPPASAAAAPAEGGEDLRLYRSIVERVHAGEGYYEAAGEELRRRGYPTGSVFNWRPPTYAWLLGALPAPIWGQVWLSALVLVTLFLSCALERREGSVGRAAVLLFLLVGAFLWTVDGDAFLSQELWAGVLIALSVCSYARGWWKLGLAAGMLALFYRELALPYALIAAVLSAREGRRRETVFWLVGLALYALFLTYHGIEVTRRITSADRVEADGWVQFGGASFWVAASRMNVYLLHLPAWVAALFLVLSLLGLAGWRGAIGTRAGLTVAVYVAAFAVVGKPCNDYWGLLFVPLLSFGLVRAPAALRDLFAAFGLARIDSGKSVPLGAPPS